MLPLLSQSETKLLHFYSPIFSLQTVFLKLEEFVIYRIFKPVFITMKYAYKHLDILLNCLNGIVGESASYTLFFFLSQTIIQFLRTYLHVFRREKDRCLVDNRLYGKDKKLDQSIFNLPYSFALPIISSIFVRRSNLSPVSSGRVVAVVSRNLGAIRGLKSTNSSKKSGR